MFPECIENELQMATVFFGAFTVDDEIILVAHAKLREVWSAVGLSERESWRARHWREPVDVDRFHQGIFVWRDGA